LAPPLGVPEVPLAFVFALPPLLFSALLPPALGAAPVAAPPLAFVLEPPLDDVLFVADVALDVPPTPLDVPWLALDEPAPASDARCPPCAFAAPPWPLDAGAPSLELQPTSRLTIANTEVIRIEGIGTSLGV
jgi:hypothetical protein